MRESELQAAVTGLLDLYGWLWYHTHDSRKSRKGFPDITAVNAKQQRTIFAELKGDGGHPTDEQRVWLEWLEHAGTEAYLWRPEHWDTGEINRILKS